MLGSWSEHRQRPRGLPADPEHENHAPASLGLVAYSTQGNGVHGQTDSTDGTGVFGHATATSGSTPASRVRPTRPASGHPPGRMPRPAIASEGARA